ncbi:MAG: hypothetical protein ACLQU3_03985 [Limisphaerales bacterium]
MNQILLTLTALLLVPLGALHAADAPERWPAIKANAWYAAQPWLVGCNFVPSTAINDVEMWQAESFDTATIERELGWARDLGFNTVRVFLNYVVWEADADGLKKRFDKFLAIADKLGIRVMPILFDDCNFAGRVAAVGKQPDPVPGVHNSQWVSSPPLKMIEDRSFWPGLERYVKDIVSAFGQDRRVVIWDLYNEPAKTSLPLVEATFRWVREDKPSQPLASCWIAEPFSDLINLHDYGPLNSLKTSVEQAKQSGRPVIVTEWMARPRGSRLETHLPFFKAAKIGCWSWGLVAGRTQTYFPWGSKLTPGATEPPLWFHDILRRDGTPYNAREVTVMRYFTGVSQTPPPPLPTPVALVPTAGKEAVLWRCTIEKPAAHWFKPGFDDSGWKPAPAPFGRTELNIGRQPRTQWTGADIWLRREFEMPAGDFSDLAVTMHHDEDTEVFIDGVLAASVAGFNAAYESFPMLSEAAVLLKRGKHLIAVHCRQTVGGQYLDLGIEGVPENGATRR